MIFEVTPEQIELLGDTDLRMLIGYLCEEEVRLQGHSTAAVTWGGHQNAADGGIDVRVALGDGAAISGYIPKAATGFQVKAEDLPRRHILDEMAPDGTVRKSIADLAASGGAYIIVSSRGSVADEALLARKDAMRNALNSSAPVNTLTIDFYDRRRIATWVNQHPGLITWVREKVGRSLTGWRPFGDWSSSPAPLEKPYLLDDVVRLRSPTIRGTDGLNAAGGVNYLRRLLLQPNGIVRLVGLSGVGKTRLVQALFDERLGHDALAPREAIYTDISDEPHPLPLELAEQLIHQRRRAILIVDNCGTELHRKLTRRIKETNSLLSLITIEYDITDDEPENTDVFKLEAGSVGLIERMLEERYPALATPSREVIAEFSDGNARIACALAATAKHGESLVNLRDSELFRRLFYQNKEPSAALLNAAKVCALLYSFDGDTLDGEDSELARLAILGNTTAPQLYTHVAELERRQLVQKRSKWRALLPHALAHRLANLALQDIPLQLIERVIVYGGSERMLRSFSKRLGYLHDNGCAVALVGKWFRPAGLLESPATYDKLRMAVFANVASIDPAATLRFIEQAALKYAWFFGPENQNRAQISETLRFIAYDPTSFDRCIALLKRFAFLDTDGDHSATDILASLFLIRFSGTHATAAQRASVVRTLLASDDEAERQLALRLLKSMLRYGDLDKFYSFDFGARKRDFGAYPSHRQDYLDWFGEVIHTATAVATTDQRVAPAILHIFASRFANLCSHVRIVDELIAFAEAIIEHSAWPEGWIGVRSAMNLCKGMIDPAQYANLARLAEKMRPRTLADSIRTYVLPKEWSEFDIATLGIDDDVSNGYEKLVKLCVDLGEQLATDRDVLQYLLPEILDSKSVKTADLGRGLAAKCTSLAACWDALVAAFSAAPERYENPNFLGGFVDGAMMRNVTEAESLLDASLTDARIHSTLLYLHAQIGITERGFTRLMSALDVDTVPISTYDQLCRRVHKEIADDDLHRLLLKLRMKVGGIRVAIHLIGVRIADKAAYQKPISEVEKAAARDALALVTFEQQPEHEGYLITALIKACLDRPAYEPIARSLCTVVAEAIRTHRIDVSDLRTVIEALVSVFPATVLDVLVEQANCDEHTSRRIFREAREAKPCLLQPIPDATLIGWANAHPESRYIDLAEVIRFSNSNEENRSTGWSPTALAIIEAAPAPAMVLDVFLERFVSTSWRDWRAEILASRLAMIESLSEHAKPTIAAWAKARAPTFSQLVDTERDNEERDDRNRDERFE